MSMKVADKQNKKIYYSMGEVAEMFDVNQSLIRYWESKFDILRPRKNNKGNRMFRPEDVENLKMIYHLVKECGMTLEGAKRAMRTRGREDVSRSAELIEHLQSLRSMLVEIRDMLREEGDDDSVVAVSDYEAPAEELAVENSAVEPVSEQVPEPAEEPAEEPVDEPVDEPAPEPAVEPVQEEPKSAVKPAKKEPAVKVIEPHERLQPKNEKKPSELPFYEQTLF